MARAARRVQRWWLSRRGRCPRSTRNHQPPSGHAHRVSEASLADAGQRGASPRPRRGRHQVKRTHLPPSERGTVACGWWRSGVSSCEARRGSWAPRTDSQLGGDMSELVTGSPYRGWGARGAGLHVGDRCVLVGLHDERAVSSALLGLARTGGAVNKLFHRRVLMTPELARQGGVVRSNSASAWPSWTRRTSRATRPARVSCLVSTPSVEVTSKTRTRGSRFCLARICSRTPGTASCSRMGAARPTCGWTSTPTAEWPDCASMGT